VPTNSVYMYKLLGIGHPRTGTAFTSKLLKKWGLDIGHERLGNDGLVAWQLIKKKGPYPYCGVGKFEYRPEYNCLVYNVRNPKNSIPSIVYTEDTKPRSYNFRKDFFEFSESNNPIENAIFSLYYYDLKVSSMLPDVSFRVEDEQYKLYESLYNMDFNIAYTEYNQQENTRKHKTFDEMLKEFELVSDGAKQMINTYCVKHGYKTIF